MSTLLASSKDILFAEILKPVFIATLVGLLYLFLFPAKKGTIAEATFPNPTWSKRAIWALVLTTGVWAVGSFLYLANLPSDVERGVIGPYSLARLVLMAGTVVAGILVAFLAVKIRRKPNWADSLANGLFGNIVTVPRVLLGLVTLILFLIVLLAYVQPGLYERLNTSTLQRLSPYLVGPILLLAVTVVTWRLLWTSQRLGPWFFLLLTFGLVGISWLGRLNPGGYYNVFMTAYAGIAIVFGLGVGSLIKAAPGDASPGKKILPLTVLGLSIVQLTALYASPMPQIPTQADLKAGQELVSAIRSCPGEVYIPFHTYLAQLAGKKGYAGVVEMGELRGSFGGKADPLWDEVLYQIQSSMDSQKFAAIIQDNQVFRDAMSGSYIEAGQVFAEELVFWPVTGRKVRPETIYVPVNEEGCSFPVK